MAENIAPRLDDDALDPHLPDYVRGEKRLAMQRSDWMPSWFVPWSPRNDNQNAEGPWSHWSSLPGRSSQPTRKRTLRRAANSHEEADISGTPAVPSRQARLATIKVRGVERERRQSRMQSLP